MKITTSPPDKEISVFISYARKDRVHAEQISEALRGQGFTVYRDLDDILPTEEWKSRLDELINSADAIIFLLSPHSVTSETCRWEIDLATQLSKKIAPIVIQDVEGSKIPPMLSRLNYIFATEKDRFDNAISSLTDALGTDSTWIREHSRITTLGTQWEKSGHSSDLLLRGTALTAAIEWRGEKPDGIPQVAAVISRYLKAALELQSLSQQYNEAKILALTELVDPILRERVLELEAEASELDDQWDHHSGMGKSTPTDSKAHELRTQINSIRNFQSTGGNWHPQPAVWHQNAGAAADYAEVYKFACCGAYTLLKNEGTPLQFRQDGCQNL